MRAFSLAILLSFCSSTACASAPKVAHIIFDQEVDKDSVAQASKEIDKANQSGAKAIVFEINSPGGSVYQGFKLSKKIESSSAPVTCVVDGDAASMAAYILQSCDYRVMTRRSQIMFHEPSISMYFEGTVNDWATVAAALKAATDAMIEHCITRMKVTRKDFHDHIDGNKQWWMTWQEAQKLGAVDLVVSSTGAVLKVLRKGIK